MLYSKSFIIQTPKLTKDGKNKISSGNSCRIALHKDVYIPLQQSIRNKIGRNSYLAIKLPKFLFKSGQYPIRDQEDSKSKPSKTKKFKELSTEEEVKLPREDTKTNNSKNVSSRGSVIKARKIMNVQSFDKKQ